MICVHKFEDGHGLMEDCLVCTKCGYSKYPEALSWWGWICLTLFGVTEIDNPSQRDQRKRQDNGNATGNG